jgi:hypothetical protein
MNILLDDSSICSFEATLLAEGYTRVFHSYGNYLTLFDIWQRGDEIWHVDGIPSGRYRASKRGKP